MFKDFQLIFTKKIKLSNRELSLPGGTLLNLKIPLNTYETWILMPSNPELWVYKLSDTLRFHSALLLIKAVIHFAKDQADISAYQIKEKVVYAWNIRFVLCFFIV